MQPPTFGAGVRLPYAELPAAVHDWIATAVGSPVLEAVDAVGGFSNGTAAVLRTKGGDWGINHEFQALGVSQGENWIFPPAKVHKRLTNGAEDNLWSYFNVLFEEPWATPSDDA